MPRRARVDISGEVYHVVNRANGRLKIFYNEQDYVLCFKSLKQALEKYPIDIFSFCLMPNHWHFAVRPLQDGDLGQFFGKFTQLFTQKWHAKNHTAGTGHLFQGRFKSFLVQTDPYFIILMRYVEANPLRASLVKRAEDWPWSSLHLRKANPGLAKQILAPWIIPEPDNYMDLVNQAVHTDTIKRIRDSLNRGAPLGESKWVSNVVEKYHLQSTLRSRGRPRK